jgi:hypothetical protein
MLIVSFVRFVSLKSSGTHHKKVCLATSLAPIEIPYTIFKTVIGYGFSDDFLRDQEEIRNSYRLAAVRRCFVVVSHFQFNYSRRDCREIIRNNFDPLFFLSIIHPEEVPKVLTLKVFHNVFKPSQGSRFSIHWIRNLGPHDLRIYREN